MADTLGELGLFYTLSDIAVIGRSFSDDGGGGHNPIEAAQLNCAVLTGPNIQYQTQLFARMSDMNAVQILQTKDDLAPALSALLSDHNTLQSAQKNALAFARSHDDILKRMMEHLDPFLRSLKT